MASNVKVKLNRRGVAALLKSPEVRADLEARARRIAASAGPGMEASATVGATRARASVRTTTIEAMLAEARDRRLSASLGAGRRG